MKKIIFALIFASSLISFSSIEKGNFLIKVNTGFEKNGFKIESDLKSTNYTLLAGLDTGYSKPIYRINDKLNILISSGLNVDFGFNFEKNNTLKEAFNLLDIKTYNYYFGANLSPQLQFNINKKLKLRTGIKLGVGLDGTFLKGADGIFSSFLKDYLTYFEKKRLAVPFYGVVGFDYGKITTDISIGFKYLHHKANFDKDTNIDFLAIGNLDKIISGEETKIKGKIIPSVKISVGFEF